jgi:peptidyl-dipeptidase Dcp
MSKRQTSLQLSSVLFLLVVVGKILAFTSRRTFLRSSCPLLPTTGRSARATKTTTPSTTRSFLMAATAASAMGNPNPLLESWTAQPFHLPPFAKIKPSHFPSALQVGMDHHLADLLAIVDNPDTPSFESVLVPYDQAGAILSKVSSVFSNLCSSLNTPDLQQIQRDMTPLLSRHSSATYTLPGLFDKIQAVHAQRHSLPSSEQVRLVERIYMDFTRAGAHFDETKQQEYAEIKAELASLTTQFQQHIMKDEETYELVLTEADMAGCPESLKEAAQQAALDREKPDQYVITLSRSLVEPFLTFSDRRDLRQIAFEAWTRRGEQSPDRDNLAIAKKILQLRQQVAKLHGYKTFAEYQCVDRMAKTPKNVMDLLENVWARAKESANRERLALEEHVASTGTELEGGIQPWDWRYYAEKVRIQKYDFDESLLKPYLPLEGVTKALFAVSEKLFGLTYTARPDLETYHPDVNAYEVRDAESDALTAIFLHDNYARPFKSSGAWMSEYRSQSRNLATGTDPMEGIPIVTNNNNFAKGTTTLLSFDDCRTLFHEAGHGHHGMLSDATYGRLASTNVLTDFVELPSQLMEHWFAQPAILKQYARHCQTGEPVPDELLDKLKAAKSFNQGFATIEYTACALMDMALHQLDDYGDDFDISSFEETELARLGMPQGIVMRHRPAHFAHLFASNHYAAGYYVYLWAEVLDADAFAAFEETGDIFDKDVAHKARKFIYSAGNTEAPDELFRQFRGRDPDINFMLKKKGLLN